MMKRFITGFVATCGAALSAQFPTFYHHYVQRLGGRLDQARVQLDRIQDAARAESMSLTDYIEVFLRSGVSAHRRQGTIMLDEVSDLEQMQAALSALGDAPALARPLRFAEHLDPGLLQATLGGFVPGLPLTFEGLAYAAAGLLAGLFAVKGSARAFGSLHRNTERVKRA